MLKLYINTLKLSAEANYVDGKIEILKGSYAKRELSQSFPKSLTEKRDWLIREGIIKDNGQNYVFTKNYTCKSASEASSIITGVSSNGMLYWKNNEGKTLGSIIRHDEDD